MITAAERVAVICSGLAFFLLLLYLVGRRPVIFVGFFFILFTLAWRTLATMYIDLHGPVYSSQLGRDVGPGIATVVHCIAYVLTLLPFLFVFRPANLERWRAEMQPARHLPRTVTLADATFVLSLAFFTLLFFNLIRQGSIPLFHRIERYQYNGGVAHHLFSEYGILLAFWIGLIFAARYLRAGRFDLRMVGLLCVMLAYSFLTGSRFSAFYSLVSFFILPWAAVLVAHPAASDKSFSWIGQTFASRRSRLFGASFAIALAITVSFALYNSLTKVRGYEGDEAWHQFFERVLIQPSEIGWTSFERVFESGQFKPSVAFNFLFQDAIDPNRNTTMQYLMFATIGEPRTTDQILKGFQLAGGFPEIFFELFGPYLAWPFLLGAGCIAAALTGYIVRGSLLGHYASAFIGVYVLYGFYVMYIGGMLNFVMPWTYWAKVTAFIVILFVERRLTDRGFSLVPWNLLSLPRSRA
jgi:hypothetical protein